MSSIHFETAPGEAPATQQGIHVPKPALYMAAALATFVILLAASARLFGFGAFRAQPAPVVAERLLRFEDTRAGGIRVIDAATNVEATTLPPGTNGFLRGALRALSRERRMGGIGSTPAFRLVRYADGRIVLHDPATTQQVTISSFGPTQVASFDALMP